ncbi:aldo/keto reductase [Pseudonocardia sp. WMMC193]|uniref:aldo/keto reductase n=1 Tax=Pseudonocardia sp. WMMC193 TaxID=2911965 RepID=UPI001F403820|nr:aldo/keto reductase [Pseudonocardia sp. WMMC193]MCF7551982.1 aldo/keto reductase [Pseudonocardia sp. WMMC193]
MTSAITHSGPAADADARPIASAGTFRIGEGPQVRRLGFGAMRITGPGVWGPPADPKAAIDVLRRAVDLGVNLIDTADSYGPETSEDLIREALHPYEGLTIATKAGQLRPGPGRWVPCGRPDYLRQQCELSLRRLGVERIDLFQLHRVDPLVPADEQFGVLAELQSEGKIGEVGLSEVSVEVIEQARRTVPVATVQNRYNLVDRSSDDVLRYCTENGLGFMPWHPVAAGGLAEPGGAVAEIAWAHGVTAPQVALAWLLQRSSVMLPIPGTSDLGHLEDNCAAAELQLSLDEVNRLDEGVSAL